MDNTVSTEKEKLRFFLSHLLRGLLWLGFLIGGFIIFKKYVDVDYLDWLKPVYERPGLVFLIYSASELFFGIIPPEIFMMWSLRDNNFTAYLVNIALLAVISYAAGFVGYLIGRYLENTRFFKVFKKRVFGRYEKYLYKFGAFIIIVAAATPLPFSGVSMLIGSVDFPLSKYLLFALTRFVRFFVYSLVIWEANAI